MTKTLPFVASGTPLASARKAWVLVHGRGDNAHNFIRLANDLVADSQTAAVAPLAPQGIWYPYSFMAPLEHNEPYFTRSLEALDQTLEELHSNGIDPENTYLLGFSQGGCLALEYAARRGGIWGGIVAFSGALITTDHEASLNVPVIMTSSEGDAHIPAQRFLESTQVLLSQGATVSSELYPGSFHGIRPEDFARARLLPHSNIKN